MYVSNLRPTHANGTLMNYHFIQQENQLKNFYHQLILNLKLQTLSKKSIIWIILHQHGSLCTLILILQTKMTLGIFSFDYI